MNTTSLRIAACLLLLICDGTAARAQSTGARPAGDIFGRVVDVETSAPISGATVLLRPSPGGTLPGVAGPMPTEARGATTDFAGEYGLYNIPAGRYEVQFSRPGYRAYSIVVERRGQSPTPLSVALTLEPVALRAVQARAQIRDRFLRDYAAAPELELAAGRWRQSRVLTTDAHEMTLRDVTETATLGEPDLLRAVQRLPGVSTRSEYTAELWTRGASWNETRVYFDGVPLFSPLHGLGTFSGVSPGAVGALFFYPGVKPASVPGGAAAAVELESRRGRRTGGVGLLADISLIAAGAALDRRSEDGQLAWMLSGRHSYMDWLTGLTSRMTGAPEATPNEFWDVSGRIDAALGTKWALEGSGLLQSDEVNDERTATRAQWSNRALRGTLAGQVRSWNTRHTFASSEYQGTVRSGVMPPRTESGVSYGSVAGEWRSPTRADAAPEWSVGYEAINQRARYDGLPPFPSPRPAIVPAFEETLRDTASAVRESLTYASVWGERMLPVGSRVTLQLGLRADAGSSMASAAPVRFAPRLSARYHLNPRVVLSAGAARTYQYAQALAPVGVHVASLSSDYVWRLAGPGVPAQKADIATLGIEAWPGSGWVATANAFERRSSGMLIPDPVPGPVFTRAIMEVADGVARGFEISVRRVVGAWSAALSYSRTLARLESGSLRFPSPAERPDVLEAAAFFRPLQSLRLGGSFSAASGVAYTRVLSMQTSCQDPRACDPQPIPWLGQPNADRAPAYASLDLHADWNTTLRGHLFTAYAQIRNTLGRENGTWYLESEGGCSQGFCTPRTIVRNRFEPGVPRLPVIGVRIAR